MNSLDRLKTNPKVWIVDDERNIGNGIIINLKDGWCINDRGCHTFGEDTPASAAEVIRNFVKPCDCEICKRGKFQ